MPQHKERTFIILPLTKKTGSCKPRAMAVSKSLLRPSPKDLADTIIAEIKTIHPAAGRISVCLQNIKACGDQCTADDIEFFMFLPNGTGYICQAKGSLYWKNIPKSLEHDINAEGVNRVAMGKGDSWLTIHRDGTVGSYGVSDSVLRGITANMEQHGGIKVGGTPLLPWRSSLLTTVPFQYAKLSHYSSEHFFVECMDGAVSYVFPAQWEPTIAAYITRSQEESAQVLRATIMNQSAAYSAQASLNAARNMRQMSAASAMANAAAMQALSVDAALATMSWGNFEQAAVDVM